MMHFQRQRQNNETNLDQLSAQLSRLEMEKRKLKRTLLQHTAAVLSKSIEELEQPTLGQDTQQLVQLESQIKQTTTRLNQLLVKHQYPKPAHSFNALVQQLDKQLSYYTSRIQSYKDKLEAKATYRFVVL
jgi:chromosome segregation ATPase